MSKFLALDIGNVLCHIDQSVFTNVLSEKLNISINEANRFFKRFWEFHDLGFTNVEDELIDKLGVKSSIILDTLNNVWGLTIFPNNLVIDFINNMKEKYDIKVALLSNIGVEHAEMMKDKLATGGLYSDSIKHFSCFVGARKPSYLYYQSFLSIHPEFQGCMYIDDNQQNIEAGALFGFKSYKFSLENYYPYQTAEKSLEDELEILKNTFIELNNK